MSINDSNSPDHEQMNDPDCCYMFLIFLKKRKIFHPQLQLFLFPKTSLRIFLHIAPSEILITRGDDCGVDSVLKTPLLQEFSPKNNEI